MFDNRGQSKDGLHRIQVAVPVPLRQTYDYLSPEPLRQGTRVLISFGRRKLTGIVAKTAEPRKDIQLRVIDKVLDEQPTFSKTQLNWLYWAAEYYHHPIGEVFQSALPVKLRKGEALQDPTLTDVFKIITMDQNEAMKNLSWAPQQKKLYDVFRKTPEITRFELETQAKSLDIKNISGLLKALENKGLIEKGKKSVQIEQTPGTVFQKTLTTEQAAAIEAINQSNGKFQSFVLSGVTGSGKTEVYLHTAEHCISKNLQVLILVPEISLTPQLIHRFKSRLGSAVVMQHSAVNNNQRYLNWWLSNNGQAQVILGTRSAIFTPLKKPGLIVVDEEHDQSYKQQDGFRYHARDMAIKRASLENIPVVLGSATPSMESFQNCAAGKYLILNLTKRIGKSRLPKINLVDTGKHPLANGLTPQLIEEIQQTINQGNQVILYVNRRGYAPVVQCANCLWKAICSRCTAHLTYHKKSDSFRCHHCGKIIEARFKCPDCNHQIHYAGVGTQRIEDSLINIFPKARVARFDRDEITNQAKLEHMLNAIHGRQIDIIIGTQLISKGHDFPGVSLVGVITTDQGLYSIDFRSTEYLFQKLVQVAGRAGRSEIEGKVVIQTAHPENQYLQLIRQQNFNNFYQICASDRKLAEYPPFGFLALWRAESPQASNPTKFLRFVKSVGHECQKREKIKNITIMDPVISPMEKLAGRYRSQLLVKSNTRASLHSLLTNWVKIIESSPQSRKVRWSLDIDPVDLF